MYYHSTPSTSRRGSVTTLRHWFPSLPFRKFQVLFSKFFASFPSWYLCAMCLPPIFSCMYHLPHTFFSEIPINTICWKHVPWHTVSREEQERESYPSQLPFSKGLDPGVKVPSVESLSHSSIGRFFICKQAIMLVLTPEETWNCRQLRWLRRGKVFEKKVKILLHISWMLLHRVVAVGFDKKEYLDLKEAVTVKILQAHTIWHSKQHHHSWWIYNQGGSSTGTRNYKIYWMNTAQSIIGRAYWYIWGKCHIKIPYQDNGKTCEPPVPCNLFEISHHTLG